MVEERARASRTMVVAAPLPRPKLPLTASQACWISRQQQSKLLARAAACARMPSLPLQVEKFVMGDSQMYIDHNLAHTPGVQRAGCSGIYTRYSTAATS